MHSLIKTNDVQDAIRRESIRGKISMLDAERRAIGYVNEIVSDYSHSTIRFAEMALARLWTQLYDGLKSITSIRFVSWLRLRNCVYPMSP